jgi:6-pyruvoyltetrahydropterin/6-carboxytetrahydropterin synthase
MEKYEGLILVDFVPTSENLCKWWHEVANKMLNDLGIEVVAVEYWETPKSHCRYQPE